MRIVIGIAIGIFLAALFTGNKGQTCNVVEKSDKHWLLDKKRECTPEERKVKGLSL